MITPFDSRSARERRHLRVRKTVTGTTERPRLVVFRSSKHIYAQIVDDSLRHTLTAAGTLDPVIREQLSGTKTDQAGVVGKLIAERALAKGITKVVFDRGGWPYHGRIAALAAAAREGGLQF